MNREHTTWHATEPVTSTSTLTPEYLSSRGFDGYRQMLRVQEHDGYIAVGTSVLARGYVETLPMKALGSMKSVVVKFRICPMPGCVETIRFDVEKAGVVTSVKVDGQDVSAKSCWLQSRSFKNKYNDILHHSTFVFLLTHVQKNAANSVRVSI